MIKYRVLSVTLSCLLILQAGCLAKKLDNEPVPVLISSSKVAPVFCEDDPLDFYNAMPVLDETDAEVINGDAISDEKLRQDCLKLRKAIKLSLPGSKTQDDEKALILLNELKQNSALAGRDLKFSLLLLQHVTQRQQLRKLIEAQDKRRMKTEQKNTALKTQLDTLQSQLDQLKNIEIEIDKKERSVISPIGE